MGSRVCTSGTWRGWQNGSWGGCRDQRRGLRGCVPGVPPLQTLVWERGVRHQRCQARCSARPPCRHARPPGMTSCPVSAFGLSPSPFHFQRSRADKADLFLLPPPPPDGAGLPHPQATDGPLRCPPPPCGLPRLLAPSSRADRRHLSPSWGADLSLGAGRMSAGAPWGCCRGLCLPSGSLLGSGMTLGGLWRGSARLPADTTRPCRDHKPPSL